MSRYQTNPVSREKQKAASQRYWAKKRAEDPQALADLLNSRNRARYARMKADPEAKLKEAKRKADRHRHAYDNAAYIDERGA